MNPTRATVLGATGPTGRALACELLLRGVAVRVASRSEAKLRAAFGDSAAEIHVADALDPDATRRAVDGVDVAFDCIGLPADRMEQHVATARNVAAALRGSGARGLQVSSYWCYMPIVRTPVDESHPRTGGPAWARLRREAEDILRDAGAAIVHLPDFYGPGVHTSTLQMPLEQAVSGKKMRWIGGVEVARDYAYVPDAMRAVADLASREEARGEDWIVPGSGPISGAEVARRAGEALGRPVRIAGTPWWMMRLAAPFSRDLRGFLQVAPAYLRPISYDASKLRRLLGGIRLTPHAEAIRATVEWLQTA